MHFKMPVMILAVVFSASIFLFTPLLTHAANADIVINEIGAYEAIGHEWIEIYNKGSAPVDLTNWKFFEDNSNHGLTLAQGDDFILSAGDYAIIVQNDVNFKTDYPLVTSTIFDSSWGALNESGEEIGLKDTNGVLTEQFTYIAATNFSLERKNATSADYSANNWREHADGNTVGKQNAASILPPTPAPAPTKIVINEFVSDPQSGENEWIELYNQEIAPVDLTGWTVHDGAGQIVAPTSTILGSGFFVIEFSSNKLNNGGDIIILKNPTGDVADQVSYGTWDDGNVSNNAIVPAKGNAVARKTDGGDTNTDADDFAETITPTKSAANIITSTAPPPSPAPPPSQPSSNVPSGGSSYTPHFPREVVINEIVSDPSDDTEEFIELFNTTGSSIDFSGWYIEEGSEARTEVRGTIPSKGFFVVNGPQGNLNNAGDSIELFDGTNKLIDRITYGTWDDGNVSNNAPAPRDPESVARKVDGQDADNDQYDFVLTSTVTKGKPNVISQGGIARRETGIAYGVSSVVINEIFPNPKGSDTNDEFIELKNHGVTVVDLANWQLSDGSDLKYTITQGRIEPNGLLVFKRSQTKIALNNTGGDSVKLFMPGNVVVDFVSYSGSVQEEFSYARIPDGAFKWTSKPTSGKENVIEGMSAAPVIALDVDTEVAVGEPVTFDASDTVDPDGETMNFTWQFGDSEDGVGDSVEHRFAREGVYTVTLTVTDASKNTVSQKVVVTVKNRLEFVGGSVGGDPSVDLGQVSIDITEIFPNPEGSDATEFIELFNAMTEPIDLSGLKLDDELGGSRAYVIPAGTIIEPGDYMVFGRQDTKLALNNTTDAVRLLYPDGTIIREVMYDDVEEGVSYALNQNHVWEWTGRVTPGEANIIKTLEHQNIKTTRSVSSARSRRVKPLIETTLDKIREEDVGDRVKVAGIIAVPPGVLGSQYFYIANSITIVPSGAQVYMYKKDFPKLAVGDRVEVTGELSEAYGETRIKVAEQADIQVGGHGDAPSPVQITIADMGEPVEGQLVRIEGEITDTKSSYVWVDDGSEEVKVYFKRGAGIDKKLLREGDTVSIAGIVQQTQGGYQIAPRFQEDVVKTGVNKEAVAVLQSQNQEGDIAETYLTATAGGITSIVLGLLGKVHGNKALGFARRFGGAAMALVKRRKDMG